MTVPSQGQSFVSWADPILILQSPLSDPRVRTHSVDRPCLARFPTAMDDEAAEIELVSGSDNFARIRR